MRGRGVRAEGNEKMGEEIHFNAITANSLYAPCPLLYALSPTHHLAQSGTGVLGLKSSAI